MERTQPSSSFSVGSILPAFSLPATDGKIITDKYLRDGYAGLVLFTCNHCPYVKGSEREFISIATDFLPKGLRIVAISSNDAQQYPEDSMERMREKAAAMSLPYPYLYDESQSVAKTFDAACTPEAYLFDGSGQLVFHGTINNSPRDSSAATKHYLREALDQAFSGQLVEPAFIHPIGCSIKWKT